jgi:hypothetical protein
MNSNKINSLINKKIKKKKKDNQQAESTREIQ